MEPTVRAGATSLRGQASADGVLVVVVVVEADVTEIARVARPFCCRPAIKAAFVALYVVVLSLITPLAVLLLVVLGVYRVADGDVVPCGALYAGGRIGQVGELSSMAHYARGKAADGSVFSRPTGFAPGLPRQA